MFPIPPLYYLCTDLFKNVLFLIFLIEYCDPPTQTNLRGSVIKVSKPEGSGLGRVCTGPVCCAFACCVF